MAELQCLTESMSTRHVSEYLKYGLSSLCELFYSTNCYFCIAFSIFFFKKPICIAFFKKKKTYGREIVLNGTASGNWKVYGVDIQKMLMVMMVHLKTLVPIEERNYDWVVFF